MTMEELRIRKYDLYAALLGRYEVSQIRDILSFEELYDGFVGGTIWSSLSCDDFDAYYTSAGMRRDWVAFLAGVWWSMNN